MGIVVEILITLASWLAIMFVSTNLAGLIVRESANNRELNEIASASKILAQEVKQSQRTTRIVGAVLIVTFLGILGYFWNAALMAAGLLLILSRVPDLIWELKSGSALERGNIRKPQLSLLSALLAWCSLPVVWYSIYQA